MVFESLPIIVANYVLATIGFAVCATWVYFLGYMIRSFKHSPRLYSEDKSSPEYSLRAPGATAPEEIFRNLDKKQFPKVTVILPARNEERFLERCLTSLISQDYPNFEIMAVNDSSSDGTAEIMRKFKATDTRVRYVDARPKPEGWVGKNWACYEGYLKASGDLFLFTDADTQHSNDVISLAVSRLVAEDLDAITAIPRLLCNDFYTRVTLPPLFIFLHTRFSPLRVNDPNTKTGYFFGSFYLIKKAAYEEVGTHKGVSEELVEDGALGGKVKEAGLRMKMVRGEDKIDAVWARDLDSLWHGLRRLMIPLYYQNKKGATLMTVALFFLLLFPFAILTYSSAAIVYAFVMNGSSNIEYNVQLSSQLLFLASIVTVSLMMIADGVQSKFGVFQSPAYAVAMVAGSVIICFAFGCSLVDAANRRAVNWRDRAYTVGEGQHPIH